MKRNRIFLAGALGAGAVATAWTARTYLEEKYAHLASLRAGSRVIHTPSGDVEFASQGDGPPILIIHGGGGGYDQGLILANFIGPGFHWISPSRFGYLRTPMPEDASPGAQADVYPYLLDFLEYETATIIGLSAGGPSSLQFALRHPDRCRALLLLSAINQPLENKAIQLLRQLNGVVDYLPDFGLWMAVKAAGPRSTSWLVRSLVVDEACDVNFIRAMQRCCLPLSERLDGTMNDLFQAQALPPFPFDRISLPTLVVHGTADSIVPYAQGQAAAEGIPGAEFLPVPGGSHLWMATHKKETLPVIRSFLDQHA